MRFRLKCVPELMQETDGSTGVYQRYIPQIFRFPFWMDIRMKVHYPYGFDKEYKLKFYEEWRSASTDVLLGKEQAEWVVARYREHLGLKRDFKHKNKNVKL